MEPKFQFFQRGSDVSLQRKTSLFSREIVAHHSICCTSKSETSQNPFELRAESDDDDDDGGREGKEVKNC